MCPCLAKNRANRRQGSNTRSLSANRPTWNNSISTREANFNKDVQETPGFNRPESSKYSPQLSGIKRSLKTSKPQINIIGADK